MGMWKVRRSLAGLEPQSNGMVPTIRLQYGVESPDKAAPPFDGYGHLPTVAKTWIWVPYGYIMPPIGEPLHCWGIGGDAKSSPWNRVPHTPEFDWAIALISAVIIVRTRAWPK